MTEDEKAATVAPYDSADFLTRPGAVQAYLEEAFETADVALIGHALGVVARAKGMTALERETGLSRQTLYKALNEDGNPQLGTVLKVLRAYGLRLGPAPLDGSAAA